MLTQVTSYRHLVTTVQQVFGRMKTVCMYVCGVVSNVILSVVDVSRAKAHCGMHSGCASA